MWNLLHIFIHDSGPLAHRQAGKVGQDMQTLNYAARRPRKRSTTRIRRGVVAERPSESLTYVILALWIATFLAAGKMLLDSRILG